MGPLDVVVLGEPAIHQVIRRHRPGRTQSFQRRGRRAAAEKGL